MQTRDSRLFYSTFARWVMEEVKEGRATQGLCDMLARYAPADLYWGTNAMLRKLFVQAGYPDSTLPFNKHFHEFQLERESGMLYQNRLRVLFLKRMANPLDMMYRRMEYHPDQLRQGKPAAIPATMGPAPVPLHKHGVIYDYA